MLARAFVDSNPVQYFIKRIKVNFTQQTITSEFLFSGHLYGRLVPAKSIEMKSKIAQKKGNGESRRYEERKMTKCQHFIVTSMWTKQPSYHATYHNLDWKKFRLSLFANKIFVRFCRFMNLVESILFRRKKTGCSLCLVWVRDKYKVGGKTSIESGKMVFAAVVSVVLCRQQHIMHRKNTPWYRVLL